MKPLQPGTFKKTPGEHYGTPKELWGFRTRAFAGHPATIAREFLEANARRLGIDTDLSGLQRQKVIRSLGAHHVIFQQIYDRKRVHRAYVTVHIDNNGRVYLTKNRAIPGALLPANRTFDITRHEATRIARRRLPKDARGARLSATEAMWFPRGRSLRPAWRVRLVRHTKPAGDWLIFVDARRGTILSDYNNLSERTGRARVFDPSPVTALGGHAGLLTDRGRVRRPPPESYRSVRLSGLSHTGYLDGKRVSTRTTRKRIRRTSGDFRFEAHEPGFEEVMVYYHIDRAIHYLEQLGFRRANKIFRAPVRANVRGTRDDNSWYSPESQSLTFGTGDIDDAEDGETILHELGHAIQDAITPGFGQSAEAAAMGEGFGDYLAGSYFEDRKQAPYRNAVMTWDGLLLGLFGGLTPPCLRLLESSWTYHDFDEAGDEHDNGIIWSATLWDIRRALGRTVADTIIVESHFQLDGFTTFARGARAIIDADRNLYRGRHVTKLEQVFRRRRVGPL